METLDVRMISMPALCNVAKSAKCKCGGLLFTVLFLLIALTGVSSAQQSFERTYGGIRYDISWDVQQTSDSGYIIAGTTSSYGAGIADVYLIKTNELGDTLWTKTYGGSSYESGYPVQQTSDGGYIVAGSTGSFGAGSYDVYLIRTNDLGDTLWTRTYGGSNSDVAYSVQQTSDGGFLIAGSTFPDSAGLGGEDVYLIKTNDLGDTLWTKLYGDSLSDYGRSVQQTSDGGYIIAGYSSSFGAGDVDAYLVRTNGVGDTLWTKTYGGNGDDYSHSVQQTQDGGYIISGTTSSFNAGSYDVYLIRTNDIGDTLWTRTFGGSDTDEGVSVDQTTDGGFVVFGYRDFVDLGTGDVYVIRTDASGDTLWTKTYGGNDTDIGIGGQVTTDGGVVITGYTFSFGDSAQVYLIHDDLTAPLFLSAEALDNANAIPGIDDDDQVLIQFSEPTNQPVIDALNIDDVLSLSGGHTWKDAFGTIGAATWNPTGDRLLISLSTTLGPPTVAVGDTITPDGVTITDAIGNSSAAPVVITGSFDPPVGIDDPDEKSLLPKAFSLSQNYPNPFNPMTTIRYTIPEVTGKVPVRLAIHDLRGRLVRQLFTGEQGSGYYQLTWDGRDESGQAVGSGIYLYTIHAGTYLEKMKMTMIR
jgi:hypothetical protein